MDVLQLGIICIIGMFILMIAGVPIPFALGFPAVIGMIIGWGLPALARVGTSPFPILYNLLWTPLPLFILVASLISESKIGENVFRVAKNWLSRFPGGLVITVIMSEAAMAAAVSTSAACIVTVGKISIPEMEKLGYNRGMVMGALCSGGVLGPLIPPSATMIVYSILADISLSKLFIAGIIPGILLAILLCLRTVITCIRHPEFAPKPEVVSWREKLTTAWKVWPIVILILAVMGGIYMGVVTPTEAGGLSAVLTLVMGISLFGLRWGGIKRAVTEAASINAMIIFMIVAATVFSYVVGSAGLAQSLVDFVAEAGLSRWVVILAINIILLFLGMVIDGTTIMLLTLPLLVPLVHSLGFDLVWFGIIFVVNMQIALVTPPMAMDLFMVRTIFKVPLNELVRGIFPYLIVLFIFLIILIAFPQLSLWLPNMLK